MSRNFNKDYFTMFNYADYLDRYDRYEKLTVDIVDLLKKIGLQKKDSRILDYGCAVGFLVEALTKLGYKNTYGYDISEWAIQKAKEKNLNIIDEVEKDFYDVIYCLDVVEHMYDDEIDNFLSKLDTKVMVVRIPVSTDGGESFHLSVSRRDPTHINCKTKEQWKNLFKQYGFDNFLDISLSQIYNTTGVWCTLCLKN